jgi:hypothetical protein
VLSDRRQDSDPAIFDFENSLDRIAIIVPDFDPVQTVDHDLIHFIGDSMISISGQAIDAGSHEEMCTSVLSRAKEFIDVALAITDMDAPPRIIEKVRGLFQIFQPPNAFFLLDGNARLIDLSFEGGGSFEFLPRPEFDRCHSKREPFGRNSETRMHQNSASRMRFGAAGEISSTVGDALRNADQLRPLSLIGELCCVVKHKHKAVCRHCAVAGRLKMTGKNIRLTDPFIGEKAIGRLGIGPILANERYALTHGAPDPLKQYAKPLAKPRIPKFAFSDLSINPSLAIGRRSMIVPRGSIP